MTNADDQGRRWFASARHERVGFVDSRISRRVAIATTTLAGGARSRGGQGDSTNEGPHTNGARSRAAGGHWRTRCAASCSASSSASDLLVAIDAHDGADITE
jgi:hypothetical protein